MDFSLPGLTIALSQALSSRVTLSVAWVCVLISMVHVADDKGTLETI